MQGRIQWKSITPVHRLADAVAVPDSEPLTVDESPFDGEDDTPPVTDWYPRIAGLLAIVSACAWVGTVVASRFNTIRGAVTLDVAIDITALAAPPLVLIALAYLIAVRTSRSETVRFAKVSQGLRGEQARLEAIFAHVTSRIDAERRAIADDAELLSTIGNDTAARLAETGATLKRDIVTLGQQADALRAASGAARSDMTALIADVPRAHGETQALRATLDAAGLGALQATAALDAQIAALVARARDADEVAGGAAQKLSAQLARVESSSATAGSRLVEAAGTMTDAIDAALARAAQAADGARQVMDAQGTALLALVDQGEAAIARTGATAADAVGERVATTRSAIDALGAALDDHAARAVATIDRLDDGIGGIEARFAAIDAAAAPRNERLSIALAALADQATSLGAALDTGTTTANTMIGRTETLMTALDAVTREIEDVLPAAFARVNARAEESRARIAGVAPAIGEVERAAGATLDRLIEGEAVLAGQQAALDALGTNAEDRLEAARVAAADLVAAVEAADVRAVAIADGAGAQLIDAMVRVRETAQTAAERAREAIERVIPASAERLGDAVRAALIDAVGGATETRLIELTTTAERAVAAANRASDRLMRQMLTIAETSAQVEARIAEAHAEIEEADGDTFARRVALLIESLNSTAIDVTKILGSDVADSAWAAYLKGDRGVFTRRAVRLLDTGEAREIARVYADDGIFREQVNRYVHDFEAMLRNVLATRSGASLSVTLLSSDMGKLYVALAQAIERLRN